MLSLYRTNPNNSNKRIKKAKNTNFDNKSHTKHDDGRPQMTSNDLILTQTKSKKKNKNILKTGSMQENIEINEHYLDETLQNNNSWTLRCVIITLYSYSYTSMIIIIYKIVFVQL